MLMDVAAQVILGGIEGSTLSVRERAFLSERPVLGVTLFRRNMDSLQSLHALMREVSTCSAGLARSGPLFAVDQEGGRVSRLHRLGVPDLGPAYEVFRGHPEEELCMTGYGAQVGLFLKRHGFHLNFAPVVDLFDYPQQQAIGDRCFDRDPERCVERARAYLAGLQSQGVLGCLKHYPGQGRAKLDTHVAACAVPTSFAAMESHELLPYSELNAQVKMIMVSHCIFPQVDPQPVYASRVWLEDILRQRLGYTGVIVSDDMTMSAVGQNDQDLRKTLKNALLAGVDMFLACRNLDFWRQMMHYMVEEAQSCAAVKARLLQAATRIRSQLLTPGADVAGVSLVSN